MQENRPEEFKSGYNGLKKLMVNNFSTNSESRNGSSLGFEIFLRIVFINLSLAQSN